MVWRILIVAFMMLAIIQPARAAEDGWEHLSGGAIVLFRHAYAPGVGDPPGFDPENCATQRNLDARGRAQARAIGEAFRQRGIAVGRVIASQWCRATETAELAFPGQTEPEPAFNSFFGNRRDEPERTAAARRLLAGWEGPGVLVAVSHQVNISALTGLSTASGEGLVVAVMEGELVVKGRIRISGAE